MLVNMPGPRAYAPIAPTRASIERTCLGARTSYLAVRCATHNGGHGRSRRRRRTTSERRVSMRVCMCALVCASMRMCAVTGGHKQQTKKASHTRLIRNALRTNHKFNDRCDRISVRIGWTHVCKHTQTHTHTPPCINCAFTALEKRHSTHIIMHNKC